MWVKVPIESISRVGTLLGDWMLEDALGVNFEIHDEGQLRFYWNGAPSIFGSVDLRDDKWHLITFVRDEQHHKLYGYVDNFVDINYSGAIDDKMAYISHYIGRDSRTGDTAFHGLIDDVQIYNYALTSTDISVLYDGLSILPPSMDYECFNIPVGDLNEDCRVDISDFKLLSKNWLLE
jgi:hypothetical protein